MTNVRNAFIMTIFMTIALLIYFNIVEISMVSKSYNDFKSKEEKSFNTEFNFESYIWKNDIKQQKQTYKLKVQNSKKIINKIDIFDLNKPQEPKELYDGIKCRESAYIRNVSTTLCVHNPAKDVGISAQILKFGIWEKHILDDFVKSLQDCIECLVFDVGANIGQYSLFAAKLNRKVISVEPFQDNIQRIHKASLLEKTTDQIILVKNALSDSKNKIMLLTKDDSNIGGQSLLKFKNKTFTENDLISNEFGRYLVKTAILDDFIDYLPLDVNNKYFKKAIMKIDIEGFEPYAFKQAKRLFDSLKFMVIFMEFVQFPKKIELHDDVQNMINFLYDHGLKPFNKYTPLSRDKWKTDWPHDVIWRRD